MLIGGEAQHWEQLQLPCAPSQQCSSTFITLTYNTVLAKDRITAALNPERDRRFNLGNVFKDYKIQMLHSAAACMQLLTTEISSSLFSLFFFFRLYFLLKIIFMQYFLIMFSPLPTPPRTSTPPHLSKSTLLFFHIRKQKGT